MATKKQKAKRALKDIGLLVFDAVLRGELAPDIAGLLRTCAQVRKDNPVFDAQLKVADEEWTQKNSSRAATK